MTLPSDLTPDKKQKVIHELAQAMREFDISPTELEQEMAAPDPAQSQPYSAPLWMYLLLAVAGVAVAILFAAYWKLMGGGVRTLVTLGAGMVLHIAAMSLWQKPRGLLAGKAVLLIACLIQSAGWFVLLSNFVPALAQSTIGAVLVFILMGAQEWVIYRHYRLSFLLFFVTVFAYAATFALLQYLGAPALIAALVLGLSMLCLGHGLRATRAATSSPAWFALGSCLYYAALFKLTRGNAGELLYLASAALGIHYARRLRSVTLLASTTFFIVAYEAYFATQYLMQTPLWSLSLVMLGVMAFLTVGAAVKYRRRYFLSGI
jgi:hypothetical protein